MNHEEIQKLLPKRVLRATRIVWTEQPSSAVILKRSTDTVAQKKLGKKHSHVVSRALVGRCGVCPYFSFASSASGGHAVGGICILADGGF